MSFAVPWLSIFWEIWLSTAATSLCWIVCDSPAPRCCYNYTNYNIRHLLYLSLNKKKKCILFSRLPELTFKWVDYSSHNWAIWYIRHGCMLNVCIFTWWRQCDVNMFLYYSINNKYMATPKVVYECCIKMWKWMCVCMWSFMCVSYASVHVCVCTKWIHMCVLSMYVCIMCVCMCVYYVIMYVGIMLYD